MNENQEKLGLIKVEVYIDLNKLDKNNNEIKLETTYKFNETLITNNVKELVEEFTLNLKKYLNEEEKNGETSNM